MELQFVLLFVTASLQPQVGEPAAQAFAKQYQIDQKLDQYSRKLASNEARQVIGHATLITKLAVERSFSFKWEF